MGAPAHTMIFVNFFPRTTNPNYKFRVITPWDYHNYPDQPINGDLQVEVYDDTPLAPIVGTIYCSENTSGQKNIKGSIKNNNDFTVQVFDGNRSLGSLLANEEKTMTLSSDVSIPPSYSYSYNIKFKASGKPDSNITNKSDTIHLCSLEEY